jgi:hypothetical protein
MNYTCDKCKADFEEDDIVWANQEGQLSEGRNNFAWCVPCLPAQEVFCGDHIQPIRECRCLV